MKKCAFLSMDSLQGFECYDNLLFDPLKKEGWQAEEISWHKKNVNWSDFDVVIIRSTWDYQNNPDDFITTLEEISKQTSLENNLDIVKWNINKTYLIDLENKNFKIVRTLWGDRLQKGDLKNAFYKLESNEIIIKPVISANADFTFRLTKQVAQKQEKHLLKIFKDTSYMIQPFVQNIVDEGEYSLFYFNKIYSHCILKTPQLNDFRVQEEHGGILKLVKPEPQILETGQRIINTIRDQVLYARVDLTRTEKNSFTLMELELIEPSLYFNMDTRAPKRFVKAFIDLMKKN